MGDEFTDKFTHAAHSAVEGQRFLDSFMGANGGALIWQPNDDGSYSDLWRVELVRRIRSGETTACPHLVEGDASYWLVYRPAVLGCFDCRAREVAQVIGTPADDICDHCGGVDTSMMHPIAVQIPGGLRNVAGRVVPVGPVTITGGLCERCFRRDPHIPDDAGRGRRRRQT